MSKYFTDYNVLTKEESLGLIPEGRYDECVIRDFSFKSTEDSKYLLLIIDVYRDNSRPKTIFVRCFDEIFRKLCDALKIVDKYESKTINPEQDLKNKEIGCVVVLKEGNEKYKANNAIVDFYERPSLPDEAFADELRF